MNWLEPLAYEYMLRAIGVSALVGVLCAMLSCFLVLKGWSLIGDALSHAIVPGVAVAYIVGLPYTVGAAVAAALATVVLTFLRVRTALKDDVVIGVVLSLFFSLGLFIASISPISVDITSIVLGNMLAVSDADILQMWVLSVVAIVVYAVFWRTWLLVFFDPLQAAASGIVPKRHRVTFFIILGATIVVAMKAVGAFMVVAMVVIPGASAHLLTQRFLPMLLLASLIGGLSGGLGVYFSYFLNGATGGVVVLMQTVCFVFAFVWTRLSQLQLRTV